MPKELDEVLKRVVEAIPEDLVDEKTGESNTMGSSVWLNKFSKVDIKYSTRFNEEARMHERVPKHLILHASHANRARQYNIKRDGCVVSQHFWNNVRTHTDAKKAQELVIEAQKAAFRAALEPVMAYEVEGLQLIPYQKNDLSHGLVRGTIEASSRWNKSHDEVEPALNLLQSASVSLEVRARGTEDILVSSLLLTNMWLPPEFVARVIKEAKEISNAHKIRMTNIVGGELFT